MPDIADGSLNNKYLQLPSRYTQTCSGLPTMKASHQIGDLIVQTRRPGFLEMLGELGYCDVYKFLVSDLELSCPTWEEMLKGARDTQKMVTNLLSHVMTWYRADWMFPERADDRRKTFQWDQEFRQVVLIDSPLVDTGNRGYDKDAKLTEVSKNMIRDIWKNIQENAMWQDKHVVAEVMSDPSRGLGPNANEAARKSYITRFDYNHWATILKMVLRVSGPALDETMARFNDARNLGDRELETFGHLAASSNWASNHAILSNRFLSANALKKSFIDEVNAAGLRLCYRRIKEVLVATLEQGYARNIRNSKTCNSDFVNDESEWKVMIEELKRFGGLLGGAGHAGLNQ